MNKEIKEFIKSLFAFIPFAFGIYVVLVCLWGDWAPDFLKKNLNYRVGSYGHMFTRIAEVKQTKDVDLLFLGSSHTYRGFDTRIFKQAGYNAFNLGSSSQTPIQTKILLERYLTTLNPDTVIYEVYPGTFSSDGVESSLDLIANDNNDLATLKMAFKINHIKTYNTLIYGFYRDIFNKNASFSEPTAKDGDQYVSGGYVEKNMSYYKPATPVPNKWRLETQQLRIFEDILDLLKAKNIPVILVQAPVTASEYAAYANNDEVDKILSSYGVYYNFNGLPALNDSLHFYDAHHLNQAGVEIFNRELIERVFGGE